MGRDFAKNGGAGKRAPARKKSASRSTPQPASGSWRWYGTGVLTGLFLSFLIYLGTLPPTDLVATDRPGAETETAAPPKPRFDFYKMLPAQTIEDSSPAPDRGRPAAEPAAREYYLLQAGSFRQRKDADRRRAELLLLGLEPSIEESSGENGRWFRVYLGPFDSRATMSRARSLTAAQNIDTLLLKRGG